MKGNRIRLLILCSSMSGGGVERNISTLLHFLDQAKFDLHLCLFRREMTYPVPDGVKITVLEKYRPWDIPIAIGKLARLINRETPDILLSTFAHPNFIAGNALVASRQSPKWIAMIGSNPQYSASGWLRVWMHWLYQKAELIVCNSQQLMPIFTQIFPFAKERIRWIPNPNDFQKMDDLAAEPLGEKLSDAPQILAAGRLSAEKRIDLLLEAFASIKDRTEAKLHICGSGPLREELECQVKTLGISDRVSFHGFCENVYPWMANADLFAMSSDHEGLPTALIEAQGLGLAAVSTNCATGPGEIIEAGVTGLLVPTGDASQLAEAILSLISDPKRLKQMGEAARERARRLYSAAPIAEEFSGQIEWIARAPGSSLDASGRSKSDLP